MQPHRVMVVLQSKAGFPSDLETTRMSTGSESGNLKQNKVPPSASATFGAVCQRSRFWDFLVLALACAALMFGLLLSSLSRLTHEYTLSSFRWIY
jgi:hypothetical protein